MCLSFGYADTDARQHKLPVAFAPAPCGVNAKIARSLAQGKGFVKEVRRLKRLDLPCDADG